MGEGTTTPGGPDNTDRHMWDPGATVGEYPTEQSSGEPGTDPDATLGTDLDQGVTEAAPPSRTRRWARKASIAALYSIALIGAGVIIGWVAFSRTTPTPPTTEVVQVPIVPETSDEVTMPDVRGLDESTARTALTDSGIPADVITVATRPAAGTVGVVVIQDPAYGTAAPTQVLLTVSTEAAVPDVIGQPEDDATTELMALGARVEVKREYDPNTDPGLVLATDPKAGKPITDAVTLTVAETAGSAYLTQLPTVDGSNRCSTTTAILGGQQYDQSLECSAGIQPTDYTWLLADKTTTFEATIGVPDDGDQTATATVEILVDGTRKTSGTVSYTKPLPVTVDTKGGTQLTVRLTRPETTDDTGFSSSSTTVVIADGRLLGSTEGISELAGWAEQ